jgi:hypothetical protein
MEIRRSTLSPLQIGSGSAQAGPETESPATDGFRLPCAHALLRLGPTGEYADTQLDDTAGRARRDLLWRPPVRLSLRARASSVNPPGTFGFGFWNDPFALSLGQGGAARKLPAAPQCAWFFYGSPPLDLPLKPGVPGAGWKAATLRFRAIPLPLLAPLAAGGVLLTGLPFLRKTLFSIARVFYRAEEALLRADPAEWHAYAIDWLPDRVRFFVDGGLALESASPPRPPLGLVLWIDNQYAVASPVKGFGFGVLPLEREQNLELERISIESESPAC